MRAGFEASRMLAAFSQHIRSANAVRLDGKAAQQTFQQSLRHIAATNEANGLVCKHRANLLASVLAFNQPVAARSSRFLAKRPPELTKPGSQS